MQFNRLKTRKGGFAAQAGYTITEVSVVLTVMGLVVGGVLKAQEMIENARITATLSQVQQFQAAVEQFQIKYNSLPGDFAQATTYIAGGSVLNGNGNGIIGQRDINQALAGTGPGLPDSVGGCSVGSGTAAATDSLEARQFWIQMSASGLLTAVRPDSNLDAAAKIGVIFPDARMGSGGGWQIVNCVIGGATGAPTTGEENHWLRLGAQGTGTQLVDAGTNSLAESPAGINTVGIATDYQAYQLDRRFDDGIPSMGAVRTASFNCMANGGTPGTALGDPTDTYSVIQLVTNIGSQHNVTCVMYFRM